MKKILIALDFNPTAMKVAERGYALAQAMNAEAVLLHVISTPVYYASTDYSPIMGYTWPLDFDQLQVNTDSLKKASHLFLDHAKLHLANENIRTMVSEGDFADAILNAAGSIILPKFRTAS